jgi:ribose 1,5-bisphosphokinase
VDSAWHERHGSLIDRTGIKIGPGRLVLVVGPSGAGKDTLIEAVRRASRDEAGIVFPRRVVTRPSSGAEDHDTVSNAAFDQAATGGAFVLWWTAHGLKYGIPAAIDDDIRAGRTVVCNVSRTVIGGARERYARVTVALITAPQEILAARLRARGRGSDGSIMDRVQRSVSTDSELNADVVIENIAAVESAAATLLRVVSGRSAESKS